MILQTTRNKVSSVFLYLGALIGSLVGMLEIFGLVMLITEKFYERYDNQRCKRMKALNVFYEKKKLKYCLAMRREHILLKSKVFNDTIESDLEVNKKIKVYPECFNSRVD